MAQRSAHFTRPDELPEPPIDETTPTFATSLFGFGGVPIP